MIIVRTECLPALLILLSLSSKVSAGEQEPGVSTSTVSPSDPPGTWNASLPDSATTTALSIESHRNNMMTSGTETPGHSHPPAGSESSQQPPHPAENESPPTARASATATVTELSGVATRPAEERRGSTRHFTPSVSKPPASTDASAGRPATPPGMKMTPGHDTGSTGHACTPSFRGEVIGQCLIVIAALAAVATIFIISTIVLATKISSGRHRRRARLLEDVEMDTEMVCMSAGRNDKDKPPARPKHPKSNGALIPCSEDSEGDTLTLNSYLPDTDGGA